jgi:hypothetical protein
MRRLSLSAQCPLAPDGPRFPSPAIGRVVAHAQPRSLLHTASRPSGHDVVDFKSLAQRRCEPVWCSRTETAPCRAARPAQSGLPPSPPYPARSLAPRSPAARLLCQAVPNTGAAASHRVRSQGSLIKQASDSSSPTHCSHALPPPHQHSTAVGEGSTTRVAPSSPKLVCGFYGVSIQVQPSDWKWQKLESTSHLDASSSCPFADNRESRVQCRRRDALPRRWSPQAAQ